jgi:predicted transcriptional regulator
VASTPIVRRAEMPAEPTQARRFGKARTAQSGALHEDYVELISDLLANGGEARPTDIARRLGVSHATAIKTIGRLKREGLAVAKPYRGVFLTEAGERLAERVRGSGAGRRGHRAPRVGHQPGGIWPVPAPARLR